MSEKEEEQPEKPQQQEVVKHDTVQSHKHAHYRITSRNLKGEDIRQ